MKTVKHANRFIVPTTEWPKKPIEYDFVHQVSAEEFVVDELEYYAAIALYEEELQIAIQTAIPVDERDTHAVVLKIREKYMNKFDSVFELQDDTPYDVEGLELQKQHRWLKSGDTSWHPDWITNWGNEVFESGYEQREVYRMKDNSEVKETNREAQEWMLSLRHDCKPSPQIASSGFTWHDDGKNDFLGLKLSTQKQEKSQNITPSKP